MRREGSPCRGLNSQSSPVWLWYVPAGLSLDVFEPISWDNRRMS